MGRVLAIVAVLAAAAAGRADERPLTSAAELRRLPPERAAEQLPVAIEATVIAVDPQSTVFVQDGTGGTYLNNPLRGNWERGQRLRITGKTYPGLYVTGVRPDRIEVLGTGPLPDPARVTADDLASGRWHYQFVELQGVVRSATPGPDGTLLRIAAGSDAVEVRVAGPPDAPLVGAAVTVRGLAAGGINDRRQLVRAYVKVPTFADVRVDSPADADPFALPLVPVAHLMRFSPDDRTGKRVRVRGVVTYHRPGEALGLRDGADAVYVESAGLETLRPGDLVEVVGFPRTGGFRAELADAEYRKAGAGPPPDPVPATVAEILTGAREADLVSADGELVEGYATPDGDVLALRAGATRFRARCPPGTAAGLTPGSVLSVTGVCRVADFREGGYRLKPLAFEVWPRTPDDVRVVSEPSPRTTRRLLAVLGVVAGLAAFAFGWVGLLRRQVRRQTAVIREQSRREAVLDERHRIAREVHDTLEQELVGLSLRLEATSATLPPDGQLAAALETARRLVGRIHGEVRSLVWDLRDETGTSLPDAIRGAAATLDGTTAAGGGGGGGGGTPAAAISVSVAGEPWPVPAVPVHNLKRVAQEAITNALKHAGASAVRVEVRFEPAAVTVSVSDDGKGFDPAGPAPAGHFGLVGMRERVRKLAG